MTRKFRLILNLAGVYAFLIIGFTAPLVLCLIESVENGNLYKVIVPSLSAAFVAWFQKSASQLLQNNAAFAIPGVYELRQKYLLHVNHLEKMWLALTVWAIIFAAL